MAPGGFDIVGIGAVNVDWLFSPETAGKLASFQAVPPNRELALESQAALYEALSEALDKEGEPEVRVGGSSFNTLHVLGRMDLGLNVAFIGVEGSMDEARGRFRGDLGARPASTLLREAGVNHALMSSPDKGAGACLAGKDFKGRRLLTWAGANREMAARLEDVRGREQIVSAVAEARVVHVTSFLDGDTPALLASALEEAKQRSPQLRVSFDPGFSWVSDPPEGFGRLFRLSDYVLLNEDEFWHLDNADGLVNDEQEAALRMLGLCDSDAAALVLKVREGATAFTTGAGQLRRDDIRRRATQRAVDDTGAGDAFAAGFLAGLIETDLTDTRVGMVWGSRIATERVLHRHPEWYGPVAKAAAELAA